MTEAVCLEGMLVCNLNTLSYGISLADKQCRPHLSV